jgi:hypothetical protein
LTVQAGTYDVKASKPGYNSQTKQVTVNAGETKTLDFSLQPIPKKGWITGTVKDASTNNPIESATVEDGVGNSTLTDSSGKYTLEVQPGTYNVKASKSGYTTETKQVTVDIGETKVVDFELTKLDGWLTGTVKDSKTLNLINGAEVKTGMYSTTTDASGKYNLSLPAGDYEVTISAVNYESKTEKVTIEPGKPTTLNVFLNPKEVVVKLSRVEITPKSATVKVGDTQKFKATAYDENNNVIKDVTFTWILSDSVGEIDKSCGSETTFTATAEGTGTLTVKAVYDNVKKSAKATITVEEKDKEEFPIMFVIIPIGIIVAVVCILLILLSKRRKKLYPYEKYQKYHETPQIDHRNIR